MHEAEDSQTHSIPPSARIVRAPDLLMTDLDGETILMGIEQGAYYGMEETARRIWQLLETPKKVNELCLILSEEYSMDPESSEAEILDFLAELIKEGLVVVAED